MKRDIEQRNVNQLFQAIKNNKLNQVQALLNIVDNIEARDRDGNTFINVAA